MVDGDRKHGSNVPTDEDVALDIKGFNPHRLTEWVKLQERWAKQIARDDRRYGEASLMLTYAKELLALLEYATAASIETRGDVPPAIGLKHAAGIAVLVQRIAEVRSGAQSQRRAYGGYPLGCIRQIP
jgi:hypothetical protein